MSTVSQDVQAAAAALLEDRPLTPIATLRLDAEAFLVHEARLLEDRRYEEWLELFDAGIRYWAPVRITREDTPDILDDHGLCHFDDDLQTLGIRIGSLRSKKAWAEIPPSRTRRLITNVQIADVGEDRVTVRSNFLVHRSRLADIENQFVGSRDDVLVKHDDSWKIASRRIVLDCVVINTDNISIFL